jgi:Protein of unknown function (DUF3011)/Peptidase inhibitor family I36
MRLATFLRFFGLAFVFLILPAFASAQQSITCEANNDNRKYCGNYNPDQVRLERQISGSPCIEGQTWGVDRSGLWVEGGCRAVFTIGGRWNGGGGQDSIKCESNDGRRNYCGKVDRHDRVTLEQQISGSPCVQGRSWGIDRRGLWVDDGCRAIFRVGGGWNGGGPGPGGPGGDWWDPDPNDRWPPTGNWHGGNWGRGGACFYKERNFSGSFFCLRRGESRDSLGDYGDTISSVRIFGSARVTVYDDRNFRGSNATSGGDIPDLRGWRVNAKPGHTWNNRISSLRVR